MIILSVGMPRAGSGWYYNLTNDLMLASGAQDARQIRQLYHLQNILTEVNCNIGALTTRRLIAVLIPSILGNSFVIKAHSKTTPLALFLARNGLIRATYIYRDPRDAMLSALENGLRARQSGRTNAFSPLINFETALDFMLEYAEIWNGWIDCSVALHVCYEDLLTNFDNEAQRLTSFLGLNENPALQKIIDQYRPGSTKPENKGLHFSQGKIGRFREEMSTEQQAILARTFAPYLQRMGYPI